MTPKNRVLQNYWQIKNTPADMSIQQFYQQTINELNKYMDDPYKYKLMGDLYLDGVPEQYDVNGNITNPGVSPNVKKAIECYQIAAVNGNIECFLDIAAIYHWGVPGYEGSKTKARSIYEMLMARCQPENPLYQIAAQRLQDLTAIPLSIATRTTGERPEWTRRRRERPRAPVRQEQREQLEQREQREQPEVAGIRNDMQNTHDGMVMETIKNSVDNLRLDTRLNIDKGTMLRDIQTHIRNMSTGQKQRNALRTLTSLDSNNTISSLNSTDIDVLHLVWNRINDPRNEQQRATMIGNLVNELAECVEHDSIVCCTGRVNRIVDSLNMVDKDVVIKPQWAINKELMDKAAVIREEMLTNHPNIKAAMDKLNPTTEEQQICDTFTDQFKEQLYNVFRKEYIESGIMSEDKLNSCVNGWIDHIA